MKTPTEQTQQSAAINLETIHDQIWEMIATACISPASDLHWPMLATTTSTDGSSPVTPNVRTVVLRSANADEHWLESHSIVNSAKIDELAANPNAMMAFYDKPSRQQIRALGVVGTHINDKVAKTAWQNLSTRHRAEYGNINQFAVLRLKIESIDWLCLGVSTHTRARFTYTASGLKTQIIEP